MFLIANHNHNLAQNQAASTSLVQKSSVSFLKTLQLALSCTLLPQIQARTTRIKESPPTFKCHLPEILTTSPANLLALEPKKDWFQGRNAQCGNFLLATAAEHTGQVARIRIASSEQKSRCNALNELLTQLDQIPACSPLVDIQQSPDLFTQSVQPRVYNQASLSMMHDDTLQDCAYNIMQAYQRCDQDILAQETSLKAAQTAYKIRAQSIENDKDRFKDVFALTAILAPVAYLGIEVGTIIFAADFQTNLDRPDNYQPNTYTLGPNSLFVIATSLAPLLLARLGVGLGQAVVNFLMKPDNQITHINASDSSNYTMRGAMLATFVSLIASAFFAAKAHNQVNTPNARQSQLDFLNTSSLIRLCSSIGIRTLSPLVGALITPRGQQTFTETLLVVVYAQLAHLLTRPIIGIALDQAHKALDTLVANTWQHNQRQLQQLSNRMLGQYIYQPISSIIGRRPASNLTPVERIHEKIKKLAELVQPLGKDVEDLVPQYLKNIFICSMTLQLISDPVALPARNTEFIYDSAALQEWLSSEHRHPTIMNSPVPANIQPAAYNCLQAAIEDWLDYKIAKIESGRGLRA